MNYLHFLTFFKQFPLQSPRNGEDLSDAENEVGSCNNDEAATVPRESSPEDGLGGGGGQVRVKVRNECVRAEKHRHWDQIKSDKVTKPTKNAYDLFVTPHWQKHQD